MEKRQIKDDGLSNVLNTGAKIMRRSLSSKSRINHCKVHGSQSKPMKADERNRIEFVMICCLSVIIINKA